MEYTDSGQIKIKSPKNILIIDDDEYIRASLSSYFEDREYTVFNADNGQSGLDIFAKQDIDIVITDLRMPKIDGIEVMKTIQATNPEIPMIVISGAGKEEDIINALRMGAKDYITKPIFDLDIIKHTVERVLEIRRLNMENKLYRNHIEKSEIQHRTITENIAEGVFTLDNKGQFSYANQVFCTMAGYSGDEILQKKLSDIAVKESLDIIGNQTQHLAAEATSRFEIKMVNKSSQTLDIELACSSMFDENDTYQGTIAVARDITQLIKVRDKYKKFLFNENNSSKNVIPICASCKNIRANKMWVGLESYFNTVAFSHGICPACCEKLYPEFDFTASDMEN